MISGSIHSRCLVALALFISYSIANAQVAYIEGIVKSEKNEPLSSVTVLLVGTNTGTFTDLSGSYKLSVPVEKSISIKFSSIGYDSLIIENIILTSNETRTFNVILKDKLLLLQQIEVTTERNRREVSIVKIQPRSVKLLPSAFGDFSKILSTLPGVVANNEFSSTYSVRGGNFDENLIYINGFEVYRPFLVRAGRQEGLSVINTDLVEEASFYAGGWGSSFGDKLSSVLDIKYKKPEDTHGSATIGLLGGSAHLEGTSKNKNLIYLIGARNKRGRYLLNTLDVQGEYFPNFTDVQGYFDFKLNPEKTMLSIFASYASNRYEVEPATRETEFGTFNEALRFLVAFEGKELLNYDTWQTGFNIKHVLKKNKIVNLSVSGVKTWEKEYGDVEGGYRLCDVDKNPGSASFNECVTIRGIGTNYYHARNTLEGNLFNADLKIEQNIKSNSLLEYGIGYDHSSFEDYLEEYNFTDSADYVSVVSQVFSSSQIEANTVTGFFQFTKPSGRSGEVQYGMRLGYRDLNDQWLVSPRIRYSYQPDWVRDYIFRTAVGLYQQQPLYREMRSYDGQLNTSVKAQQSVHFIAGFDHNFTMWERPFKWTVEGYYKYLWDVIPYDVDNVRIRYFADNIAVAYATGLDTRVSGEFIQGTESWFSLSLLSTRENINNDGRGYLRRPSDQRLTLGAFFEDHLPDNPSLRVNLGLLFGSGLPFGPPNSFENKANFRGDSYQRVDIGFSKIIDFENSHLKSLRANLEILNLLGANNTISYTWIQDVSASYLAIPNTLSNRFFNLKISLDF